MIRRCLSTVSNISFSGQLKSELWKSYLRKTSNHFICIKNKDFAKHVSSLIVDELKNDNTAVFEATPGFGLLTEQLLQNGVPRIRIFEHLEDHKKRFDELKQKFGDQLEICDKQILDFVNGNYKLLDLDRETMFKECFDQVPIRENWASVEGKPNQEKIDPSIQLITGISPVLAREFLTFLVYSLSRFEYFFINGPMEFYVFLPLSIYLQINSRPSKNLNHYTAFTIHLNSLFDFTEINTYSPELKGVEKVKIDNGIHTIISNSYFTYTNNRTIKAKDSYVFLKITPKPVINKLGSDFLINYVTFVKQSFIKRSAYAIKYYEKHFPGCGVELIGLGISYFKTLGDLTHDEIMLIFTHLFQTPQYQNSIFKDLC